VLGFYEDVPTCRPARDDMPRWFRYEEVAAHKPVFGYMLRDAEYQELLAYMKAHRHRYRPRGRPST
jgi:hypothetical protein